jgi:hypothetical protein
MKTVTYYSSMPCDARPRSHGIVCGNAKEGHSAPCRRSLDAQPTVSKEDTGFEHNSPTHFSAQSVLNTFSNGNLRLVIVFLNPIFPHAFV